MIKLYQGKKHYDKFVAPNLPTNLSGLLEVALNHVQKLRRTKNVTLNMNTYRSDYPIGTTLSHYYPDEFRVRSRTTTEEECHVCMAGSILYMYDMDVQYISPELRAIDAMRQGLLVSAYHNLMHSSTNNQTRLVGSPKILSCLEKIEVKVQKLYGDINNTYSYLKVKQSKQKAYTHGMYPAVTYRYMIRELRKVGL